MYRHFIGTISETTQKKDCWNPTPMPMKTWLAMSVFTSLAQAPMMLPTRAIIDPMMKNHLLPKISESCPTKRKTMAPRTRFARGTQRIFGDGPMSSLIWVKTGAIKP